VETGKGMFTAFSRPFPFISFFRQKKSGTSAFNLTTHNTTPSKKKTQLHFFWHFTSNEMKGTCIHQESTNWFYKDAISPAEDLATNHCLQLLFFIFFLNPLPTLSLSNAAKNSLSRNHVCRIFFACKWSVIAPMNEWIFKCTISVVNGNRIEKSDIHLMLSGSTQSLFFFFCSFFCFVGFKQIPNKFKKKKGERGKISSFSDKQPKGKKIFVWWYEVVLEINVWSVCEHSSHHQPKKEEERKTAHTFVSSFVSSLSRLSLHHPALGELILSS